MERKGFVLITVIGFSLIVFAGIIAILYMYGGQLRYIDDYGERLKAYYLCEAGASKAIYRIKKGERISDSMDNPERFTFTLGDKSYIINYIGKGEISNLTIHSWVKMPSGKTYHLRIGGARQQWPVFIKGYLPPLMD